MAHRVLAPGRAEEFTPSDFKKSRPGCGLGKRGEWMTNSIARRRILLLRAAIVIATLAIWQLVAAREWLSRLLLPLPSDVVSALYRGVVAGDWWGDIWASVFETIVGLAIGIATALFIGAVFAFVPTLHRAFDPFIIGLQSFPKIAIAPLLIVWLGYGPLPKILIATILAFFPVFTATIAGLKEVDPSELYLMRSIRATPVQELRHLRLPNAMAYVFPSLDVAAILALLGAIAGELMGADKGLGYIVTSSASFGNTAAIFGALFLMAVTGITLSGLFRGLRLILPVRISPREMASN